MPGDSGFQLPLTLSVMLMISALPWAILAWTRTRRYARYFQLEGYDAQRYLRWLLRSKAENNQLLAGFIIAPVGYVVVSTLLGARSANAVAIVAANIIVAIVAAIYAPRDRDIKQPFAPTQRAVRLVVTTFIIEAMPLAVGAIGYFLSRDPATAISSPILQGLLIWGIAGGSALFFFLLPFVLPLANLINFPLEEAFRRYYLGRAKGFLKRSGAVVIAITGSYGKTSTKHYLHHILDGRFRVLMTPKSYNTLLGISRVINDVLSKNVSYEYFIVETDAYFVGENARDDGWPNAPGTAWQHVKHRRRPV